MIYKDNKTIRKEIRKMRQKGDDVNMYGARRMYVFFRLYNTDWQRRCLSDAMNNGKWRYHCIEEQKVRGLNEK